MSSRGQKGVRLTIKDRETGGGQAGQQQDSEEFHGDSVAGSVFPGEVLLTKQTGRGFVYFGVGMGLGKLVQDWSWDHSRFPLPSSLFQIHLFLGTGASGKPVNRKVRPPVFPLAQAMPRVCQPKAPSLEFLGIIGCGFLPSWYLLP